MVIAILEREHTPGTKAPKPKAKALGYLEAKIWAWLEIAIHARRVNVTGEVTDKCRMLEIHFMSRCGTGWRL